MTPASPILGSPLPADLLDRDAVTIIQGLERAGHAAFLVGGCLRDLLLGVKPKDFDVATSARPGQVKRLFRNCRLIGRRFRLAHCLFRDRKIVEVATFRRAPTPEEEADPSLIGDNLFGTEDQDAMRRDFTINALFYDVRRGEFHDHVGGLEDIGRRLLRTIGDPDVRLPEDPVRILRAVKFASRLGLALDPALSDAMIRHAPLVVRSAKPRVLEEIFRILRHGAASPGMSLARDMEVLPVVLPEISAILDDSGLKPGVLAEFAAADALIRGGRALSDAVLLTTLLWRPLRAALESNRDGSRSLEEALHPIAQRLCIPKRIQSRVRQIVLSQKRLRNPQGRRSSQLPSRDFFDEAVDVFEILAASPRDRELVAFWRKTRRDGGRVQAPGTEAEAAPGRRRRRRRRRRPNGPPDRNGAAAPA